MEILKWKNWDECLTYWFQSLETISDLQNFQSVGNCNFSSAPQALSRERVFDLFLLSNRYVFLLLMRSFGKNLLKLLELIT